MSEWSHPICDVCWEVLYPKRMPYRLRREAGVDEYVSYRCCFCQQEDTDGIFVRCDPAKIREHIPHNWDQDED